jgi:hypothetical protein
VAIKDLAQNEPVPADGFKIFSGRSRDLSLSVSGPGMQSGIPLRFEFQARATDGKQIRFLEYQHEKPMHLIVVSEDLSEFDHIHPEPGAGGSYDVNYSFRSGGHYRLWADYTAPGQARRVEVFDLAVSGPERAKGQLKPDEPKVAETGNLRMSLGIIGLLRTGQDVEFDLNLSDRRTGAIPGDLVPYLGAWAHFLLIDEGNEQFIHVHPSESPAGEAINGHLHYLPADPPKAIRGRINFDKPGLYRLWVQIQLAERVITQPFDLQVEPSSAAPAKAVDEAGFRIAVGPEGFIPGRIAIPAGKPFRLVITRSKEPNCASRIKIVELGIIKAVEPGETVIFDLPAQNAGELRLSCGMNMLKGTLILEK